MSTLDQAFIRAYNKDRRAAANTPQAAPTQNAVSQNAPSSESSARNVASYQASMPAYPAEPIATVNATASVPAHEEAPAETGRWYRVDAAGNLHTRHQRMGDAPEHVQPIEATVPTIQTAPEVVRTESNSGTIQSRHGGHRLPPYPHLNSVASTESAETVGVAATHTGRRTLASYLAQNQTPSHEPVVTDSFVAGPNDIPQPQVESAKPAVQPIKNIVGSQTQNLPSQSLPSQSLPSQGLTKHGSGRATVRVDAPTASPAAAPAFRSASTVASPTPVMSSSVASGPISAATIEEKPARTITQEAARSTLKMPAVGHFKTTRTDRPATPETETAKTKFAATPFHAAWEVDSFAWPEIQAKLMTEQERAFEKVAAHFSEACHQGLQVLLVTSPTAGEGRSTVASCIARSVANRGIKVALLDGDIESPALADALNLEIAQGWNDAIVEGLPLEEVAVHSIEDGLTLIPLTLDETSPKLAQIDRYIAAVLERLRESFDLIVVDATYINSLDNRLIGTESNETIDAMILVADGRDEDQQRMETAIRRIKNMGVSSVGIVENFTNT